MRWNYSAMFLGLSLPLATALALSSSSTPPLGPQDNLKQQGMSRRGALVSFGAAAGATFVLNPMLANADDSEVKDLGKDDLKQEVKLKPDTINGTLNIAKEESSSKEKSSSNVGIRTRLMTLENVFYGSAKKEEKKGIINRIVSLEKSVFNSVKDNEGLEERLSDLEKVKSKETLVRLLAIEDAFFGTDKKDDSKGIIYQIDVLETAVFNSVKKDVSVEDRLSAVEEIKIEVILKKLIAIEEEFYGKDKRGDLKGIIDRIRTLEKTVFNSIKDNTNLLLEERLMKLEDSL